MRIVVAVVGKARNASLAAAIADYETRARRYWPLEVREVRAEPAASRSANLVREREGARLLDAAGDGAWVVACDVDGRRFSSAQFAAWLQAERERARDVALLIGGALGLSDAVRARARGTLSLAPWTLP